MRVPRWIRHPRPVPLLPMTQRDIAARALTRYQAGYPADPPPLDSQLPDEVAQALERYLTQTLDHYQAQALARYQADHPAEPPAPRSYHQRCTVCHRVYSLFYTICPNCGAALPGETP